MVEGSCPTCYKCLFLPLLGSLLSFSSGHFSQPQFYFSSAHYSLLTLLLFVNALQSSFLLSVSFWFSIPRTISALTDFMEKPWMGFFNQARREGLEARRKRYRRR